MKIIARRGEANYLHEMDRARVELEYRDLAKYIDELFYDSNSQCCVAKLIHFLGFAEDIPHQKIISTLEHHLSQFYLDGCAPDSIDGVVFHKRAPEPAGAENHG